MTEDCAPWPGELLFYSTEIRHSECEVRFPKPPWLRQSALVNLLGIAGVDNARIERRLGLFSPDKMPAIENGLARLLGL